MAGKLKTERTKAHQARCAANRMREQIGDVRAQRDAARKQLEMLVSLINSDAHAISFQTLGQYRKSLLYSLKGGV